MLIAHQIEKRVLSIRKDKVFSAIDLGFPYNWYDNVRIKLGRMEKQGLIVKVSRGKYYRPKQTIFGKLQPTSEEIIKDLLYKNGKTIGYLTGYDIWHKMGLTSQISSMIEIGTNQHRNKKERGNYKISFVIQPNPISRANIHLLQILDAVKSVRKIPDTNINDTVVRLIELISERSSNEIKKLAQLAEQYTPQVRALTGAILELIGYQPFADQLRMTLHPSTSYKMDISKKVLPNHKNWNIV